MDKIRITMTFTQKKNLNMSGNPFNRQIYIECIPCVRQSLVLKVGNLPYSVLYSLRITYSLKHIFLEDKAKTVECMSGSGKN